jgi:hypothetical protein
MLYIRRPGSDIEETHTFPDDDPFFSEVSNLIDIIEDIEEDPDAAQILSTYEGSLLALLLPFISTNHAIQMPSSLISLLGQFGRLVKSRVKRSPHKQKLRWRVCCM